jgi:hypothetical protein
MGAGGQLHALAALPPGMTRYPLYRRLSGPQGRSGRVLKISPPLGFDPPDRPARSESFWILWICYTKRCRPTRIVAQPGQQSLQFCFKELLVYAS